MHGKVPWKDKEEVGQDVVEVLKGRLALGGFERFERYIMCFEWLFMCIYSL